ncbi:MAG: membrane-bound lytic murein transglycosylase MltF [Candidatus Schmidhempelia sp.]|nr:membrane-bound lytic murein transglycosylase MltF [Candidatus Schmidhempelia sp.]
MLLKKIIIGIGFLTICLIGYFNYLVANYYKQQNESGFTEQTNILKPQYRYTSKTSKLERIQSRKQLRVGMLHSLTPFYINSRSPNKLSGFEFSLLNKYATSQEIELKIITANTLADLIKLLDNNKIDIIAEELKGHNSYQNKVIASIPYHTRIQQLVYRKGETKPYSFDDIKGKVIVPMDSLQSVLLNKISQNYPNLEWEISTIFNQEELLKLVVSKEIDYTIADSVTIGLMRRIYPSLTVAFTPIEEQPIHWYLSKTEDKSLLDSINQFIKIAQQNGTIEYLEYLYFNYTSDFDYVNTREFIKAIETLLPKYQPFFEKYAEQQQLDWRLIAAMAYQESHWNPEATSPTGVRGIMMLTQKTAEDLGVVDRLNPEQSIYGGVKYLRTLIDRIPNNVPPDERVWYALVAYNMGYSHLLDARQLARHLGKNPDNWIDIKQILPLLNSEKYKPYLKYNGARGYQALHFVNNIQQYYISLVGYQLEKEYRQKQMEAKLINLYTNDFIDKSVVSNQILIE